MASQYPFPSVPWKTIHVGGGDKEIGRQHAEQVGNTCRDGMPLFYHDLIHRMLQRRPARLADRLFFKAARTVFDPLLVNRMLQSVPTSFRERIQGMSEAAGLSTRELDIALVLPDLLPILQTTLSRAFPSHFVNGVSELRFGCSSFISKGDRFLIGRNLDFPGVAYWDRYPVIQCLTPSTGLKSISFTTAGVPIGGITGINEAQVYIAIHQHYCRQASLSGHLPFILAEQVLSKAQTLAQAIEILQGSRISSSWAFIVADGKTQEAAIWEGTPKVQGLRKMGADSVMAHSNYFQTANCQPTEYATSSRMNWDNYWRKTRLENQVTSKGGALTPADACVAISEHYDGHWEEEKVSNRTVSQLYNIQSLVVDPVSMTAWAATGDAPVHLRDYLRFDLSEILKGNSGATEDRLPGFRFKTPSLKRAKESLIVSFVHAMDGREDDAFEQAKESLAAHFMPEIGLSASIQAMKFGQYTMAEDWLQRGADWITEKSKSKKKKLSPEYFEIRLFQARLQDILGHRSEAKAIYQDILANPDLEDANVRRLAAKSRPYRAADLEKHLIPYASYIPFN